MNSLNKLCTPRESVFDPQKRDTVLDLTDLVDDRIAPAYERGSAHLTAVLDDLEKDTHRSAMSLEPVRLNSDELYLLVSLPLRHSRPVRPLPREPRFSSKRGA